MGGQRLFISSHSHMEGGSALPEQGDTDFGSVGMMQLENAALSPPYRVPASH